MTDELKNERRVQQVTTMTDRQVKCPRCDEWCEPGDEGDPNATLCSACAEEEELRTQLRVAISEILAALRPQSLQPNEVEMILLDEIGIVNYQWQIGRNMQFDMERQRWLREHEDTPQSIREFYSHWERTHKPYTYSPRAGDIS